MFPVNWPVYIVSWGEGSGKAGEKEVEMGRSRVGRRSVPVWEGGREGNRDHHCILFPLLCLKEPNMGQFSLASAIALAQTPVKADP